MAKIIILNKEVSPRDYPLAGGAGASIHFGRREKQEVEESQISEAMRKAIQRGSLVIVEARPVTVPQETQPAPQKEIPAGKGQKGKG